MQQSVRLLLPHRPRYHLDVAALLVIPQNLNNPPPSGCGFSPFSLSLPPVTSAGALFPLRHLSSCSSWPSLVAIASSPLLCVSLPPASVFLFRGPLFACHAPAVLHFPSGPTSFLTISVSSLLEPRSTCHEPSAFQFPGGPTFQCPGGGAALLRPSAPLS